MKVTRLTYLCQYVDVCVANVRLLAFNMVAWETITVYSLLQLSVLTADHLCCTLLQFALLHSNW